MLRFNIHKLFCSLMEAKKSTARRDKLISLEQRARHIWERNQYFAVEPNEKPKFFQTFPFPYMNGTLHLGHAFSMTKCDFNAWYKRLAGFNVLFPFGYHCTGMLLKIMKECQYLQLPKSWNSNCSNMETRQLTHKKNRKNKLKSTNMTLWGRCTFQKRKSKTSPIQLSGWSTSRQEGKSILNSLECTLIMREASSQQKSIPTTILSFDGSSLCWKSEDILSMGKDHPFTPLKISKCALITIELKDKVSLLKSTLWSKLKLSNWMKHWRRFWKEETCSWLQPHWDRRQCTDKLVAICCRLESMLQSKWKIMKSSSAVNDLLRIWPTKA